MKKDKPKRASPWIVFSALCLITLAILICCCLSLNNSAGSVVADPRGLMEAREQKYLEQETEEQDMFPEVDWQYWKDINPDIIAWVTVPNTDIDYAIVQASKSDPIYYLGHDIYRDWSP